LAEVALPQLGDVVGGKYRIEGTLGRGGMGTVFEAAHVVTGRHFAIKWLHAETTQRYDAVKRFIREAQVAGRCAHPNIVEVYDIDQTAESYFMVMELLVGESLAERIGRVGRLLSHDACGLLMPCMEAISVLHEAGIVHRDLKPANIFVCESRGSSGELAKVLDFGVSRMASPPDDLNGLQTLSGAVMGTPYYMSPEQMRGQPVDGRADVYSLGVTLYEVLSGRRPYHAESYADLIVKIIGNTPTPLGDLVGDLPGGLGDVVKRAMHSDPAARYASMQEFVRALEPFRQVQAHANAPAKSEEVETQRFGQRRKPGKILLAGIVLLLTAAGWLGWRMSTPSAPTIGADEPSAGPGTPGSVTAADPGAAAGTDPNSPSAAPSGTQPAPTEPSPLPAAETHPASTSSSGAKLDPAHKSLKSPAHRPKDRHARGIDSANAPAEQDVAAPQPPAARPKPRAPARMDRSEF
jgi:serine/threonine protein kinase